jgi:hypothetical protein
VGTWRSDRTQAKPVPLHKLTTPNDQVTTIGTVSRFAINKQGNRRANMTLEGSQSTVECIIWSNTLSTLESDGRIPTVGQIVGVTAKVKIAKVIKRPTEDLNDSEGDYEVVEDTPRTELQINDIWSGDLDDPATINLPPVGIPAFRIATQTATNPPHLEVVQPKLIPVAIPAPVSVTTTASESPNTAAGSESQGVAVRHTKIQRLW